MKRVFLLFILWGMILCYAEAAPCVPAAVLTGDTTEINAVAKLLLARGVATTATENCPSTKVRIIRVEKQLLLEIEDSLGRTSRRLVFTYEGAATVIESWVYDSIDSLSFEDFAPKKTNKPPPLELSIDDSLHRPLSFDTSATLLPLPKPYKDPMSISSWRGVDVALLSEFAVSGGGSLWFGFATTASQKIGPLQVSILARYLRKSSLELSSQETAGKVSSAATADCTPIDTNNDGIADSSDCTTTCILLDIDQDGALDDKQCQSEAVGCVTLDLNNDGTIEDFQCQGLPAEELNTGELRNSYGLQGELGLPIQRKGLTLTPSAALGVNQLFSQNIGTTKALLHMEAIMGFSRNITSKVRLDSRVSFSFTPNMPDTEGQSTARISFGFSVAE
jgi:hypothetical protein